MHNLYIILQFNGIGTPGSSVGVVKECFLHYGNCASETWTRCIKVILL